MRRALCRLIRSILVRTICRICRCPSSIRPMTIGLWDMVSEDDELDAGEVCRNLRDEAK